MLDVSHCQRGGTSNLQYPTSNIECARSDFAECLPPSCGPSPCQGLTAAPVPNSCTNLSDESKHSGDSLSPKAASRRLRGPVWESETGEAAVHHVWYSPPLRRHYI